MNTLYKVGQKVKSRLFLGEDTEVTILDVYLTDLDEYNMRYVGYTYKAKGSKLEISTRNENEGFKYLKI